MMEKEPKSGKDSYYSMESLIKEAITSLNQMPGSTFNEIHKYIQRKTNDANKDTVINAMKKMRKTGLIIQMKCYFRLPYKVICHSIKEQIGVNKKIISESNENNENEPKKQKPDSKKINTKKKVHCYKKDNGKAKKKEEQKRIFRQAPNKKERKK